MPNAPDRPLPPAAGLPETFLTIEDCAAASRSSYGVIYKNVRSGALASGRAGRRILIRRDDLLSWIAPGGGRSRKTRPTPAPGGEA